MPRLPTRLMTTALVAAILVFAGCQRQPDAANADPDAAAPAGPAVVMPNAADDVHASDAHPTDVLKAVDHSGAPEGVDARALAGQFGGTLPCADCPGLDTTLTLDAEGAYKMHESYRERDVARDSDGTWTAEQDGKTIRLDPNSKDEDDRLFRLVSNDELEQLDMDGNPPDSDLDYSLRRRVAAK